MTDEPTKAEPQQAEDDKNWKEVTAEMAANVWKVLVKEGDTVAEDDTLVILESMKMEIPVLSEYDGVVARLKVAEGEAVAEGAVIALIDDSST